jgi:hypothetical protein
MKTAEILGKQFIQRWDVRAEQLGNGGYICIREPLTPDDLDQHVLGQKTLGAYVLDERGHARYTVLDADTDDQWEKLTSAHMTLKQEGVPSYRETSRRGGHLWFFFERAVSGVAARSFGEGLSMRFNLNSEVFPKSVTGDVGSLVRLPLGVHKKSGERYPFIDEDGLPIGETVRQQAMKLEDLELLKLEDIAHYKDIAPLRARRQFSEKRHEDVFAYISQLVELKPTKSGGIGHCPFHDDEHMSFSVNKRGNYWHCFAGCGGGEIGQFKKKWKEAKEAVDKGH